MSKPFKFEFKESGLGNGAQNVVLAEYLKEELQEIKQPFPGLVLKGEIFETG